MNLLRHAARSVSSALGRNSPLINTLRPVYDQLLDWSSGGRGIVQTLNGHERFRIDPHYRLHFPETYDTDVHDYLRDRVQPGAVSLNIGAHVGIYALCLARWSEPDGRVFAFEPNPATRAVLEKHVALNDLTARIEVLPQAVSESPGEATFFAADPGIQGLSGLSRLGQPNPDLPHAMPVPIRVPVTTVDKFCSERGIAPDWLVMDIEGYEVAALDGARETIKAGRGRLGIVVEMHPSLWPSAGSSRERLEGLLAELRLRPICLARQTDPLGAHGIIRLEYS